MKNVTIAVFTLFSLVAAGNCFAETTNDNGWNFTVAPMFIWGKSIDGTQQIGPAAADLELNFKDDILENLDAAFTLHFEAQRNDLVLFADYQYADLDPSTETSVGKTVELELQDQVIEFGAAYCVAKFGINDLQVLGGVRNVRQDLEVSGSPTGPKFVDETEDWWDGFIGLRIFTHITDNWTFVGRGDVATGWSDITWNLQALIDYRFKDWGSVFAGYRWFDIDYDSGDGMDRFVYDITLQGPFAGLAFYW